MSDAVSVRNPIFGNENVKKMRVMREQEMDKKRKLSEIVHQIERDLDSLDALIFSAPKRQESASLLPKWKSFSCESIESDEHVPKWNGSAVELPKRKGSSPPTQKRRVSWRLSGKLTFSKEGEGIKHQLKSMQRIVIESKFLARWEGLSTIVGKNEACAL